MIDPKMYYKTTNFSGTMTVIGNWNNVPFCTLVMS